MRAAVAYIRVSKPKQGRSGLGLEAQQAAVRAFCAQHRYKIEAEYRALETGKGCGRLGASPRTGGCNEVSQETRQGRQGTCRTGHHQTGKQP
jgi:Resolvase, N terminal domain